MFVDFREAFVLLFVSGLPRIFQFGNVRDDGTVSEVFRQARFFDVLFVVAGDVVGERSLVGGIPGGVFVSW